MTSPTPLVQPTQLGQVLIPGLPVFAAGLERYCIPGGGSWTVHIEAGDEIILEDREGLQPCMLAFFAADGRSALSALGAQPCSDSQDLATLLHATDASAQRVQKALAAQNCDLGRAEVARGFATGSRPGERVEFTAEINGTLVVGVPESHMTPEAGLPPTEIVLFLRRAHPRNQPRRMPPPPLAEPLQDFNLAPGRAKGYEVRKGQYIQILDVQGRECSDFQAWTMQALEQGQVEDIDPTTTRSMTGTAYPGPGIFSKYFSVQMDPMVEIVQDTVGRHDAFNLACTARYYEDLGYPGHVNCSDNLNLEAAKYGIGQQPGWPAINFFYNTNLDANNGIFMDDPWSRPGDYVLLRALTDLVCYSTACPCDVDPANGWQPTDIQIRVYDSEPKFSRAIAYRKTPDAEVAMTKQTAFHAKFETLTRNFVEYSGYWLPQDFTDHGEVNEYWAVREKVGVIDLSPLRKFEVLGPDAEQLLQQCLTRDVRKLAVGQVSYSAMCYPHGGMIDDGTVYRLGADNFRWVGGGDASGLWLREQAEALKLNVWVKSSTDQLHNIAVQGPNSRQLLSQILWTAPTQPTVAELGWFRFTPARLGSFDGTAVVVSRTGYSGELGYEIFCAPKNATEVFDAIWTAGEGLDLMPFGLGALDLLRIEAGLVFAGQEFDDQTDPFEAGIGFTVALPSKADDFIGREALLRRKANPSRKLVGLDIAGNEVPAGGDGLYVERAQVGQITSACRSPKLSRVIALARLDVTYSELGTTVEIGKLDGQQKRIPATVTQFPHYDPNKARVRS